MKIHCYTTNWTKYKIQQNGIVTKSEKLNQKTLAK